MASGEKGSGGRGEVHTEKSWDRRGCRHRGVDVAKKTHEDAMSALEKENQLHFKRVREITAKMGAAAEDAAQAGRNQVNVADAALAETPDVLVEDEDAASGSDVAPPARAKLSTFKTLSGPDS